MIRLITVAAVILVSALDCSALSVPLTVQEALPAGTSGANRTNEIVTGGIPLADSAGISAISQLGLSGASSGQFRVLGRWPSGNIKWVLVDFPLSVGAGATSTAVTLTNGSGNFGGSNLATDNGGTITVSTGAATFVIKKANFNMIDSAVIGATSLVTTGNVGRFHVTGIDGVEYSSSNDSSSTAVIEENGPVRAVIKATGSFKSTGGTRLMDYTVRFHFYKNKSTVKGVTELRNASQSNKYWNIAFKSAEAKIVLNGSGSKTVSFGSNLGSLSGSLPTSGTAYLFQGYAAFSTPETSEEYNLKCSSWQPPLPGTCTSGNYTYSPSYTGVQAKINSTVLHDFTGTATEFSDGTSRIVDGSGNGVVLGYRQLRQFWPGGFEFKDSGDASIELYSKQNPYNATNPISLIFLSHDTREIMWDFFAGGDPGDNLHTYYSLEYPLVVRSTLSHYTSTKALFGQSEFVNTTDQATFMSSLNLSTGAALTNLNAAIPADVGSIYEFRGYRWSDGGGKNQINYVGSDLFDYVRLGAGGMYLKAHSRMRLWKDTLYRSDDGSFSTPTGYPVSGLSTSGADGEHSYFYTAPLYYYMTGDESSKEWILMYGQYLSSTTFYGLGSADNGFLRALGNAYRNAATFYEFSCEVGSCNTNLKTAMETNLPNQLDSRDTPGSCGINYIGRNLDRGYLYWDTDVTFSCSSNPNRVAHSIYHNQIHFDGMFQTYRVMSSPWWTWTGPNRLLDLEDYLTGLSKFYLDEWVQTSSVGDVNGRMSSPYNFRYGQYYDYYLDVAPLAPSGQPSEYMDAVFDASRAAVWAYQHTGNSNYLSIGANLVWEIPAYSQDSRRTPSELQDQSLMMAYLNPSSVPTWQPLTISKTDNGGGSYTLSWTVPAGATGYQIKHSSKPIVEWLGFNKFTRSYQYAPANYTPFFAAANIASNPAPTTAGSTQTLVVTGAGTGQEFSAKYYTGAVPTPPTTRSLNGRLSGSWH